MRLTIMTTPAISSSPPCDRWIIAARNRIDHPFADTGPGEDRFGQDGAGQQCSDLKANGGDHRNEGVAQGMDADHANGREPLGPRGAHIVVAEHLKHGGAGLAGNHAQRNGSEHDGRKYEMADRRLEGARLAGDETVDQHETGDRRKEIGERDPAGDRRPLQRHGKEDDEQQAPPEDRHGKTDEGGAHHRVIEDSAAAHRREDAGGNAEHNRESHSAERELNGCGKQRQELLRHRNCWFSARLPRSP